MNSTAYLNAAICFYGFAMLIGVLTPWWFGSLMLPVRKIRKGADRLNNAMVDLSQISEITIEKLRNHEKIGDKIVVPHFLDTWTRELQGKIFNSLVFSALLTGIFNISVIVLSGSNKTIPEEYLAIISKLPVPAFLFYTAMTAVVYVQLIYEQASKYKKIIDSVKPAPVPLMNKVRSFFKFI